MTPKELFAVGLRLIGVWYVVASLPEVFSLSYLGAVLGVAGLILITRADLIANFCYPKERSKPDVLEKPPGDFRDY